MGRGRESRVYRVKHIPEHLDRQATADLLFHAVPYLGPREDVTIFSLAQDRPGFLTATVTFNSIPATFDNDREEWTLQVVGLARKINVDVHFLDFTVLNEPKQSLHTVDCIAISGLASHAFGSWKYRDPDSDFMWLRDGLSEDVPQLRSLIYGYDTQLSGSQSFQNLDHIAGTFITRLKTFRRTLPAAKPLILMAHSLGGIILKRALVMMATQGGIDENMILQSLKGIVFFGVPSRGMRIEHLIAMVEGQPNEELVRSVLAPESSLLPELDEQFCRLSLQINQNLMSVYETKKSLTTASFLRFENGTWKRSEPYEILVKPDSAIQRGTADLHAIAVNKDHSNMVKFGEDDPIYQTVMSFLSDLSKNTDDQRSGRVDPISLNPVQKVMRSFSTVPFSKDPGFVGREDILAQLESEFANPKSQLWASLYGLGGIGKSQIAIEYSYRQKERSSQISTFWVHASSKARFEQSYAEIATIVEIAGTGDGKVDALQLVSNWLASPDSGSWLLIIDNADDVTVLLNLSTNDTESGATSMQHCLLDFLPRVQHGAVLITTRDRTCALDLIGDYGTPIEVRSMSMNEAVGLLRNRLPGAAAEEASELVKELEYVPLAISQASAYIREVSLASIPRYLDKFRRSIEDQATLLNKNKKDLRRDRGVPNAVITSWELSFNQIREKTPGSADLLSLMSYFNRQAIPNFLIKQDIDEIPFDDDINPLISFSLIRAEIGENTFEMHRLVQTAMRHWLQSEGRDQLWKERAIERVAHQFPMMRDQAQHWPVCETLMSHADEVILHAASSKESQLSLANILVCTARYLIDRKGHVGLAEQRSTHALQLQRQYFDDDSDEIRGTLSTLAYAYGELSEYEEAIRLQESILKQSLEKWGAEDAITLSYMHNLALSYDRLGRYEKAEDLLKRVVEVWERLFGPEDPEFLVSGDALAQTQLHQGKYEEAEKLSTRILEMNTRCHGNKLKEAENLIAQAVPLFTKILGPSHWRTLEARRLLARIYYDQRKLDEAESICISCLDTAKEIYGAENSMTLDIVNLLARIYRDQGRFPDALRLLEGAVKSRTKVFGADHPNTLIDMSNLALCYYGMGDKDHAIQLMTEVLRNQRKVLRANHPDIANSARILARWKSEEEESEEEESEEEGSEEGDIIREPPDEVQISSPATQEAESRRSPRKRRRIDH